MVFLTVATMSGSSLAPTLALGQVSSGEDRDLPASRTIAALPTIVIGYLWAADSSPIPNATLRLRNVVTGRVEHSVTSDEEGEFTFSDIEGGTYLVEYVDSADRVLAVGSIFMVPYGVKLAYALPGPRLKLAFACMLLVIMVLLLIKA